MRSTLVTRRTMAAFLVVLGSLAACDSDNVTGPNEDIVNSIQTDPQVMAVMHESNQGEITAGQTAVQKATNAQVKAFAQMMITDHTALDKTGTTLATQLGITPALPDQRLPQMQAAELQTLTTTAAGTAFDRAYIAQQILAHQRTIELVDAGLQKATRTEIRTLLQQSRPTIVAHLNQALSIQTAVGQ